MVRTSNFGSRMNDSKNVRRVETPLMSEHVCSKPLDLVGSRAELVDVYVLALALLVHLF